MSVSDLRRQILSIQLAVDPQLKLGCEMSTAYWQTFAGDLRDSQGRQLLKPRIAVSKFEKGARSLHILRQAISSLDGCLRT